MSSPSVRIPRHCIQRSVFNTAAPRIQRCRVVQLHARRWYAEEEKEKNAPFTPQLYESVYARVQRERADEERYAKRRAVKAADKAEPMWWAPFVLGGGILIGWLIGGRKEEEQPNVASTLPLDEVEAPEHKTNMANLQAAWTDFKDAVGKENVSTNEADLHAHAGSEWSSYTINEDEVPFAIVRPESTDEVSTVMKICHRRKIPVTAYSGGTSLEGHFAPTRGGICIDFSRMDQILALHAEDLDVVVQPAVGWELLNEELSEKGLFFPPDPGPGAMIGGMIGTGCSGTNAYRYGTMKDWVLSLTVVLADGTIVKTKQRPRKSSAGYDLTRTFIGSEGTLGLVTEATLKVTTKPQNTSVAVCTFPNIRSAADCVFKVVGEGVPIAAVEILDDVQMKAINDAGSTSKKWKEASTLFFKFSGTKTSVKEHISIVQGLARKAGSSSFEFARNDDEAAELWSARKEALWSIMAKRKNETDHVWTTDVAVPISRLPEIIDETKEMMARAGLTASIVGHVGDGNFHSIVLYNDSEHPVVDQIVHNMVKRAIEMEGTATGEHGVGIVKRDYLEHEIGVEAVDLMRKMKHAFDPLCLLNCDKIVRSLKPKPGEIAPW